MNPPNAVKPKPVLKVVHGAPECPEWQTRPISFDFHVLAYQWHLTRARANRAQEYIRQRCTELGADYGKVTDKSYRRRDITGPRQVIMYDLKTKFQLSYPRIGRELGGFNHATVLHAVDRIAKIRGEERPEYMTGTDRLLSDAALKQEIIDDYNGGMSLEDLSDKFAVSDAAIVTVAKLENWYKPNRRTPRSVSVKLASINMSLLKRDFESGMTYRKMIDRYGIAEKTIRKLKNRNGWVKRAAE